MTTLAARRPTVKATAVLFTPSAVRRLRNPAFGAGIFVQRAPKLPTGPTASDREWAARNLNTTADASDEEWADEFERRTLSRDEYLSFSADREIARLDRYAPVEHAELAELRMEATAEPEVTEAPIATTRPRAMTRHQANRAKRLAKA